MPSEDKIATLEALRQETADLVKERSELEALLQSTQSGVIADLYCPATGHRVALTRDVFGRAIATLDELYQLESATPSLLLWPSHDEADKNGSEKEGDVNSNGFSRDDAAIRLWSVGFMGPLRFAHSVVRKFVDWAVPKRTLLMCGDSTRDERGASSKTSSSVVRSRARDGKDVTTHVLTSNYNGWIVSTYRSELEEADDVRMEARIREMEKARQLDKEAKRTRGREGGALHEHGGEGSSSSPSDIPAGASSSKAIGSRLICIGHRRGAEEEQGVGSDGGDLDSYGPFRREKQQQQHVYSPQCLTHHDAALLYLGAVDEAPRIAAVLTVQLFVTAVTLNLLLRAVMRAVHIIVLHRRRKHLTAKAMGGAGGDGNTAVDQLLRAISDQQRRSVGHPTGAFPAQSPPTMTVSDLSKLRRAREDLSTIRSCAMFKGLFGFAILLSVPVTAFWLTSEIEESGSSVLEMRGGEGEGYEGLAASMAAASPSSQTTHAMMASSSTLSNTLSSGMAMLGNGGIARSLFRGSSWIVGKVLIGSVPSASSSSTAGDDTQRAASTTYILITLLLIHFFGVFIVAFAVGLIKSATSDLTSEPYKKTALSIRGRVAEVARRSLSPPMAADVADAEPTPTHAKERRSPSRTPKRLL